MRSWPATTYHVVGTYDGTTQRLYVNGAQSVQAALTGAITTNTNAFSIGAWNTTSEFFAGTLDEVAVYPNVLSAARVSSHYTAGVSSPGAILAVAKNAPASDGLRVSARVPTGGSTPVAVAFDGTLNRIYVTRNAGTGDHASNGITVIDSASRRVIAQITTGRWSPSSVTVNPATHLVYVTSATFGAVADHSTVKVIDPRTNKIVHSIPVGPGPKAIAVNPRTNRIYVTDQSGTEAGASVAVIDGATNTVVASIPIGSYDPYAANPTGLAVNNGTNTVYATNPFDGTLHVIDGNTNTVMRTITIGDVPTAVALNETTNTVYVTQSAANHIAVVDGGTGAITAGVIVGSEPRGIAVDALRDLVYVTADSGLTLVDGRTNQVTVTAPAGEEPRGVAVNTSTRTVVVANGPPRTSRSSPMEHAAVPAPERTAASGASPRHHLARSRTACKRCRGRAAARCRGEQRGEHRRRRQRLRRERLGHRGC